MKERLIIIIVAIIAGLFITSAGFFIYQSTKKGNDAPIAKQAANTNKNDTSANNSLYVKVQEPADESLTAKRTLVVKGVTNPENLVVVSTNLEDIEAKPTQDGTFSVTIDIDAGANEVITRAIASNGDSVQDIKTVTYSTEEF